MAWLIPYQTENPCLEMCLGHRESLTHHKMAADVGGKYCPPTGYSPCCLAFKLHCITGNCRNVWHCLTWKLRIYLQVVLPKQVSDCRMQSSLVGFVNKQNVIIVFEKMSEPTASKLPPKFSVGTRVVNNRGRTSPKLLRSPRQCADLTSPNRLCEDAVSIAACHWAAATQIRSSSHWLASWVSYCRSFMSSPFIACSCTPHKCPC